jgi:hypothetical protein
MGDKTRIKTPLEATAARAKGQRTKKKKKTETKKRVRDAERGEMHMIHVPAKLISDPLCFFYRSQTHTDSTVHKDTYSYLHGA